MKRFFIIIAVILLTPACNDDGGGAGGSAQMANPTMSDIVGAWDFSDQYENLVDEYYVNIHPNGTMQFFDYDGDTYDQGSDCYYFDGNEYLKEIRPGTFKISNAEDYEEVIVEMELRGNKLEISTPYTTDVLTRISNSPADFSPLCP